MVGILDPEIYRSNKLNTQKNKWNSLKEKKFYQNRLCSKSVNYKKHTHKQNKTKQNKT